MSGREPFSPRYWAEVDQAGQQDRAAQPPPSRRLAGLLSALVCLALAAVIMWGAIAWHPLVMRIAAGLLLLAMAWLTYENRRADRRWRR